jgi:hypothetical protein
VKFHEDLSCLIYLKSKMKYVLRIPQQFYGRYLYHCGLLHNMHSQIVKICLQLNLDVEIIGIFNMNVVCPHYFNIVLKFEVLGWPHAKTKKRLTPDLKESFFGRQYLFMLTLSLSLHHYHYELRLPFTGMVVSGENVFFCFG